MSPAGASAKTDGWPAYRRAPGVGHQPHVVGPMAAHVLLPWTHRVFANLKRWALGVYHGLREKHLQSYLDEFTFRFNRRRSRHAAFRSLLAIRRPSSIQRRTDRALTCNVRRRRRRRHTPSVNVAGFRERFMPGDVVLAGRWNEAVANASATASVPAVE